mgnify:FL=1
MYTVKLESLLTMLTSVGGGEGGQYGGDMCLGGRSPWCAIHPLTRCLIKDWEEEQAGAGGAGETRAGKRFKTLNDYKCKCFCFF